MTTIDAADNPYVGPRTFLREEGDRFFGREREARELFSLVISQRLVLFYAQSGAGKSSLINTRLAPNLQQAGFAVLPVGRIGGELPPGVAAADNIFLFNLMASLDASGRDPNRLACVHLAAFLARLASDDGEHYTYDERTDAASAVPPEKSPAASLPVPDEEYAEPNYVLIIDQFEEIFTTHLDRWRERAAFFEQLDAALRADRRLWVVLALREDYVASLDPYAPLLTDKLRARYYMERMGVDAALEAIRGPAELGGRPFAAGVAEQFVEDLRQVCIPDQESTISGQCVEPVQLQVVCYQLWENIKGRAAGPITAEDLAEAGDVNQALSRFYEKTLQDVLADPAAIGVSERQLRAWFDGELITEAGTRGLVRQDEEGTGGLPNAVVQSLQSHWLVRSEIRSGNIWIELVHDRLIAPVKADNAAWFAANLSALQRQAALWDEQGRPSGLLLRDAALAEAEAWAAGHPAEVQLGEQAFLAACREAQGAIERERRQNLLIRILAIVAGVVAILAIAASIWAWRSRAEASSQKQVAEDNAQKAGAAQATAEANAVEASSQKRIADDNAQKAVAAQATAEANAVEADRQRQKAVANAKLAQDQLNRQAGLALLQEAYKLKEQGDALGAIEKFQAAKATNKDLGIDVEPEIEDVRRKVAAQWVQQGEGLAKAGDFPAAEAKFKAALALAPPPDTPVYVYVPAGPFFMGEGKSSAFTDTLPAYWIQRTEVTNAQYGRCVEAKACEPPDDGNILYSDAQFAKLPVSGVTWDQAQHYATWVGGRLPTEGEWEKACRGGLEIPEDPLVGWGQQKRNDQVDRPYPWGKEDPTKEDPTRKERLNFAGTGLGTWSAVGSYPDGASPYGALDMAGNVWEWTSSAYADYPYNPRDGREDLKSSKARVQRGGSFFYLAPVVRCTYRFGSPLDYGFVYFGFRVVVSPGF